MIPNNAGIDVTIFRLVGIGTVMLWIRIALTAEVNRNEHGDVSEPIQKKRTTKSCSCGSLHPRIEPAKFT